MELHMFRLKDIQSTFDHYEERTSIQIVSDDLGHAHLLSGLRSAIEGDEFRFIPGGGEQRMRMIVLAPSPIPRKAGRLKIIERLVYVEGYPTMELIVYGNQVGYRALESALVDLQSAREPDEELLLTDDDRSHLVPGTHVVKRSVTVRFFHPLKNWTRLGETSHVALFSRKQSSFLPEGTSPYLTTGIYEPLAPPEEVPALSLSPWK